jgi:hypothetical protein
MESLESLRETLEEYNHHIGRNKRGVYKGQIVGYNAINLYSSFEDLYQAQDDKGNYFFTILDEEGDPQKVMISAEERENALRLIKEWGSLLHVIVYRRESGWFIFKKFLESAVLCFEDQLIGVNSDDGILTLLGAGTEKLGFYFEIPSGYPDRVKVLMTFFKNLTFIRMNNQTLANVFDLVNNSLTMNPELVKAIAIESARRPAAQKSRRKGEGE